MSRPYTGPRPFERADRHNFYGRQREVEELLDLLIAERVVLLYSPSGAGKSSLLVAGLMPRLEKEHFRTLPVMRVSRRPLPEHAAACAGANRYVLSLLLYLEEGLPEGMARLAPAQLAGLKLTEYLKQRYDFADTTEPQVLIFDQFEEVLTLRPADELGAPESMTPAERERLFDADREAKQEFFAQVGAVLRNRRRWAVFAMREDYVASLDPYLAAVPTRLANTYRLDLLDRDEALEAVCRPAESEGVQFATEAAAKLVDDLRQLRVTGPAGLVKVPGPHVEPVQLQVVCLSLWEKLRPERGRTIGLLDLDVVGDVDNALMGYYDSKVEEIAKTRGVREREVRDWFDRHLITVQGRRGQVLQGDPSQTVSDVVVGDLVNAHLVREDKRAGATWFELAHDRLLDPVRKSNNAWNEGHLSPLQRMAAIWNTKGRLPDNFLLRHNDLEEAEQWATAHAGELNEVDRAFLLACQDHRGRGEAKKSRERLVRYLTLGVFGGVVLIGVIVALMVLVMQSVKHGTELDTANTNLNTANASLNTANASVTKEKGRAERRLKVIQSDYLGRIGRDKVGVNPELTVLLSVRGLDSLDEVDRDSGKEVDDENNIDRARLVLRSSLNAGVQASRVRFTLLDHTDDINAVAYSPDGKLLATASDDGRAYLWDAKTNKLHDLDNHPAWGVIAVAFSPDGQTVATASKDRFVRLWHQPGWKHNPMYDKLRHSDEVNAVAFSPNPKDQLLAAGCDDGMVFVWNLSSPSKPWKKFPHDAKKQVNAVLFNPTNAKQLVTAGNDATVKVWNLDSTADPMPQSLPPSLSPEAVNALAFTLDGKLLATAGEETLARLWVSDPKTGLWVLYRQFAEPMGSVRALAFNRAGNWLAIGSRDSQVKVWDVNTGRIKFLLAGHETIVTGVAFNPDQVDQLATSSDDHSVKIWDLGKREQLHLQAGANILPSCVAFNGNGKDNVFVVAGGANGWAKVWDTKSGEETLNASIGHRSAVRATAFSSKGDRLLTGSDDATAIIWETAAGREMRALTGHSGGIIGVAYSRDDQRVATASLDGTARVWDPTSGKQVHLLRHPSQGWPLGVAFSEDGKFLTTVGSDGIVRVWDGGTGKELPSLGGQTSSIASVAFDPEGKRLVTGSNDGTARIWDIRKERAGKEPLKLIISQPLRLDMVVGTVGLFSSPIAPGCLLVASALVARPTYPMPIYGVAYSPKQDRVAACSADGLVHVWDATTGKEMFSLSSRAAFTVAFSPDGKKLATAGWDSTAHVWDLASRTELLVLSGHTGQLFGVAFSSLEANLLATVSADRTTRLWDATTGKLVQTLGQAASVSAVAVSPDGNTLAVAYYDQTMFVYDKNPKHAPRKLSVWPPPPVQMSAVGSAWPRPVAIGRCACIAFSPNGKRVATGGLAGSSDTTARLWDTETGRLLATCAGEKGHSRAVTAAAFSPDGRWLATGSQDYTVKLWDGATGRYRFDVGKTAKDRHSHMVTAIAFSPDGKYLATGSQDRTVKVWDVSSPDAPDKPLVTWSKFESPVNGLAFSPKGERLAAIGQSGTVKVWDVTKEKEFLDLGDGTAWSYTLGNVLAFRDDSHLLAVDRSGSVREYLLDLRELRELAQTRISPPEQQGKMKKELGKIIPPR